MRWRVGHVTRATARERQECLGFRPPARPTRIARPISGKRAGYVWRLRSIPAQAVRRGLILAVTGLGVRHEGMYSLSLPFPGWTYIARFNDPLRIFIFAVYVLSPITVPFPVVSFLFYVSSAVSLPDHCFSFCRFYYSSIYCLIIIILGSVVII